MQKHLAVLRRTPRKLSWQPVSVLIETAVQTHARVVSLSEEYVKKERIELSYEALHELVLRDMFLEMCHLEFVVQLRRTI